MQPTKYATVANVAPTSSRVSVCRVLLLASMFFFLAHQCRGQRRSPALSRGAEVVAGGSQGVRNASDFNGCGTGNFLINNGLRAIGEGALIDCCNHHDICYGDCGGKQICDEAFRECLIEQCKQLSKLRKPLCLVDTVGMVAAVELFGKEAYCRKGRP